MAANSLTRGGEVRKFMQQHSHKELRLLLRLCNYACLFIVTTFGCSGCQPRKAPTTNTPQLSPVDLFRLHCSSCHGDGTGNGHVANTLKVRPRNLKHSDWQDSVSDERIVGVIREGGAALELSPEMPAFKDKLTESQIHELMLYLRRIGR